MFLLLLIATGITVASPGTDPDPSAFTATEVHPVVLFKGKMGQRFTVVVDGQPHPVNGGESDLSLTTLALGAHSVEIRSENNLTIWGHGTLNLIPGDEVLIALEEGRSVSVRGREGVWQDTTSERPLPRKKPLPTTGTDP